MREARQANRLEEIPLGLFLAELDEDPWVVGGLPDQARSRMAYALAVGDLVTPGNWFPDHTDQNVCPRGYSWINPANARFRFSLVRDGTRLYFDVVAAEEDRVVADRGSLEEGVSIEDMLLCEVCNAVWPQRGELDWG